MRNYASVSLHHLQAHQPWTIPYSPRLDAAAKADDGLGHVLGTHALLHAQKTLGQIAAVFEGLDHSGLSINGGQQQLIADKSADLVTAAMRLANLYGFDLAQAVVERSEEKNNVTLPAWDGQ